MTNEETIAILNILATADEGCSSCCSELFEQFLTHFPNKKELAKTVWENNFNEYREFR